MAYAFKRAEGFVMITGRPGTGKTTLVGELVESLASDSVRTANLVCTQLQADDLLKTVAFSFGINSRDFDKAELLQRLTMLFQRWHQEGGRALLIVDEAQDLSVSALEELRLLTNIQIGGQPLVQIFLLGQPELRDLVMAPEMEQVHQRVIAASHLRGLEVEETEAYVAHRLDAVGWKGDPAIDRAIFPLIHKFSEGVPRRINLICSRLFLLGSVEQRHKIEVADVRDVIGELQAENLAAGSWFSEADFDVSREPEWLEVPGAQAAQDAVEQAPAMPAQEDATEAAVPAEPEQDAAANADLGAASENAASSESGDDAALAADAAEEPKKKEQHELDVASANDDNDLAPDQDAATVDVIEELFEVVTASEYVDVPLYAEDELLDADESAANDEIEAHGRRYFSGRVITESALGSEEAAAELSNLPDDFVEEPLTDTASGEPVSTDVDAGASGLDAIQRDGKAWPLSSRPAANTPRPETRTRRAVVILTLVALLVASVLFFELYLSGQNTVTESAAVTDEAAESGQEVAAVADPAAQSGQEPPAESVVAPAAEAPTPVIEVAVGTLDSAVDAESEASADEKAGVHVQEDENTVTARQPVTAAVAVGEKDDEAAAASAEAVSTQPVVKQVFVVNFGFDSADLGQDANAVLSRAVQKLQEYPGSTALIARRADGQAPGASADTIAAARANAVQRFFLQEGVAARRVRIESVDAQELASTIAGQDSRRTVQITVSRALEG